MKVLNLYACLGGNRYKWTDCEVTAVELDPEAARLYQERFPNDTVIIADAHQYLLDHFKEFDFIWSSPPCPSHSRARYEPLIPAQKRGRHLYWTNFQLPNDLKDRRFAISQAKDELNGLCEFHNYDFRKYNGTQSVIKMARNLVDCEAGLTIFNTARGIIQKSNTTQTLLEL